MADDGTKTSDLPRIATLADDDIVEISQKQASGSENPFESRSMLAEDLKSQLGLFVKFATSIDLKTVAQTPLFTVPSNRRYIIDSVQVIIDAVGLVTALPTVQFGTVIDPDAILPPITLDAALALADKRQIFDNPTDVFVAGDVIEFGVTVGSIATGAHQGTALLRGILLEL